MLWRKLDFKVPDSHLFWGVLGAWMAFKKPEVDKTFFRNGLSMSKTDLLNHKWLDFVIQLGLALHQFKKTAVQVVVSLTSSLIIVIKQSTIYLVCKNLLSSIAPTRGQRDFSVQFFSSYLGFSHLIRIGDCDFDYFLDGPPDHRPHRRISFHFRSDMLNHLKLTK